MALLFLMLSVGATWSDGLHSINARGEVRHFTIEEIVQLPITKITTKSPWLDEVATFEGPTLASVADHLGLSLDGITLTAMDDYFIELSREDIETYQPIVAHTMNGVSLAETLHGPFWLMWPFDSYPEINRDGYYMQAIWQLVHIDQQP